MFSKSKICKIKEKALRTSVNSEISKLDRKILLEYIFFKL